MEIPPVTVAMKLTQRKDGMWGVTIKASKLVLRTRYTLKTGCTIKQLPQGLFNVGRAIETDIVQELENLVKSKAEDGR